MRVSLAPSFRPIKAPGTAISGAPLLDPAGPSRVLGWSPEAWAEAIAPTAATLFGPRGLCLHPDGSFWVTDTGHHRLLGWNSLPTADNQPADTVIGQPDAASEGRNAKGPVGPKSLNVPTGVSAWGAGLAVADAWNHRVLLWRERPGHSNQPADMVLGQENADAMLANRGADHPTAASLNWPYGIAEVAGCLAVADSGNRRVLLWEHPSRSGQAADLVLGQADFGRRDENAGADVGPAGMRWPHALAYWQGKLAVADAGNNRVMLWESLPTSDGAPASAFLGQADATSCDHNGASYYPSAATVNMPYALAQNAETLIVADTANSRLLGFQASETGAAASALTGQPDFASKGDNGWGVAGRDTLCWPYGLSLQGKTLAIADSGNNRVLLWDLAS